MFGLLSTLVDGIQSLYGSVSFVAHQSDDDGRDGHPNADHSDNPTLALLVGATSIVQAAIVTSQVTATT